MKQTFLLVLAVTLLGTAFGQTKKDWSKVVTSGAGDHFMISFSKDGWNGTPDSIDKRMGGFSRGLNIAFMLNKPFKSDARLSVAFGLGISHSSIFFKKTDIGLRSSASLLPFTNLDSANHFKKYKLATSFLEAPIEIRYTADPVNEKKSWKFALGVKVGTLVNVHTKGKTLVSRTNGTLNSYTVKESKTSFFNGTRLAATARVGLGNFSLFGTYSITPLLKDFAGPSFRPYQFGLCISGL
jgi:hypothetical protein